MYLRDLKASLLRRWYLVVLGLLLTAGLCAAAYKVVPATYQAEASVVLLPPSISVVEGGNPYLYLGGLGQALDVLTRALQSDNAQKPITEAHPDATYTALPDRTTTGPILLVTVEGPTSEETLATLQAILDSVPPALANLQEQLAIPAGSRITSMNLAVDDEPTKIQKDRTRALLAAAAVGLVGTILLTGLLDGLLTSRRTRKQDALDRAQLLADPADDIGPDQSTSANRRTLGLRRRSALPPPVPRPTPKN